MVSRKLPGEERIVCNTTFKLFIPQIPLDFSVSHPREIGFVIDNTPGINKTPLCRQIIFDELKVKNTTEFQKFMKECCYDEFESIKMKLYKQLGTNRRDFSKFMTEKLKKSVLKEI